MQIILDSMQDIRDFLDLTRGAWNVPPMTSSASTIEQHITAIEQVIAADEAETPEQALKDGLTHDEYQAADAIAGRALDARIDAAEQPQKRKRRTKVEMQADAERETGLQQPGTLPEGQGTEPGASTPEMAGNAAVQAALAGDAVGAAAALANVPLGDSPFAVIQKEEAAQVGTSDGKLPAVAKPQGPEETRAWIEMTAVGKFNAITPVDHMNLAKNFIAAKGMNGYNESFGLVGLSNNIMGFTQEQRALHAAALDFLDWA